jgi:hypothetical protein
MVSTNHNYYIIVVQMSASVSWSLENLGKLCLNFKFRDTPGSKLFPQILI